MAETPATLEVPPTLDEASGAVARPGGCQRQAQNVGSRHFNWQGLGYHYGRRSNPVLTLVQDATYPHLYRIRYPDGWISSPANLSRAKDAAYGHARYLVAQENRVEASYWPERMAA